LITFLHFFTLAGSSSVCFFDDGQEIHPQSSFQLLLSSFFCYTVWRIRVRGKGGGGGEEQERREAREEEVRRKSEL